ncbi:MAG: glycoside hydrolase family 16 protein [Planctomycetes bacterium]|nr:glycoside hydrolase family 16 protein [Planctomycetota bacterium]
MTHSVSPLWAAGAIALLALVQPAVAGVNVSEHASGAFWPNSGSAINLAGPNQPENFTVGVGVRPGESAAQTFTVTSALTLSRIDVAYSTSDEQGTVQLRLQEANVTTNADDTLYTYGEGRNLFAAPNLSFRYSRKQETPGVISLEFTGEDRVKLEAGKTYAIEFVTGSEPTGFVLRRRGARTYAGGAAFSSRNSINGKDVRTLGMRIFSVEQPPTDTPEAPTVPAAANVDPDSGPSRAAAPAKPKTQAPPPTPPPDGTGFIVDLDDFANDPAEWKFFNGAEFKGATGSLTVVENEPSTTSPALRLVGDFTQGGAYVAATKDLKMPAEHDLSSIRLRYRTANVHELTVRFADGTGQVHQQKGVKLTADGQWHDLALSVSDLVGSEWWGGANDGKWHGPAKLLSINIGVFSNPDQKQLSLDLCDIRAEAIDAVIVEGDDTVKAGTTVLAANPTHAVSQADYGFKLTYRWQSQPTERDYRVFVHIVDAAGNTVYNDDHVPPVPTSKWDGVVQYTRDVCLPRWAPRGKQTFDALPEGEYTLYAGLFNALGRKPLAAGEGVTEDGDRRYRIGSLTIDNAAPIPPLGEKTLDLTGYRITFSDEFDEDIRVSAWGPITEGGVKWIAHTPYKGDFGDARFANPTDGFPFTVKDGVLRIECRFDGTRWYSGLISSMDPQGNGFTQQYGYFEMRAKFPATPGTWPGFWLHGAERVTHSDDKERLTIEIDIVEQYGHWPNKLSTAMHIWDRSGKGRGSHIGERHLAPGMTEDFHTYGAMVTPEHIIFYYDGVELRRDPTPECGHTLLYVMAELAAGPGWPLDRTPSPAYMYIDYIRAYAKP